MAKGDVYRLVEATGYRVITIPLSVWPAVSGILSDNEFQFDSDCWKSVVEEVLNMPCKCIPGRFFGIDGIAIGDPGDYLFNMSACPGGQVRRVTRVATRHTTGQTAKVQIFSCDQWLNCMLVYETDYFYTDRWYYLTLDVTHIQGDKIRFEATFPAGDGEWHFQTWGEEWTT
jgi:hypothetical protein